MKKYVIAFVILAVVVLLCFCVWNNSRFDESDVIGLTSAEIIEKYGDFDRTEGTPDADGLYRNCRCDYLIREKKVGFLGTTPPEYFMIYFNDVGIADWWEYREIV
jgi:hypothetical protein